LQWGPTYYVLLLIGKQKLFYEKQTVTLHSISLSSIFTKTKLLLDMDMDMLEMW